MLAVNVEPKPTAAFALSLLAGISVLASAFISITALSFFALDATTRLILGGIAGLLTLVGSWLLYSNAAQRKLGSVLVLVFSMISMNFVALILGLIGGFLGFTFKRTNTTKTTINANTSSSSRGFNPP